MKNFKTKAGRVGLLGFSMALVSSMAWAFSYDSSKPTMYIYVEYGKLFGCGPMQCLAAGARDEDEALQLMQSNRNGPWFWVGDYGRCRVWQGDGYLESWDLQTDHIISRMQGEC